MGKKLNKQTKQSSNAYSNIQFEPFAEETERHGGPHRYFQSSHLVTSAPQPDDVVQATPSDDHNKRANEQQSSGNHQKHSNNQIVHRHANGLCIVTAGLGVLQNKKIKSAEFLLEQRHVPTSTGQKRKRPKNNSEALTRPDDPLIRLKFCDEDGNDEDELILRCCVQGTLIELNEERILARPELLQSDPLLDGYLAVIMPRGVFPPPPCIESKGLVKDNIVGSKERCGDGSRRSHDEEFNMALKMHGIARANTRIATEAEENNLEIATFLSRVISKTNEEMKMDSRGGEMEETSVRQNSVNNEMENRNDESGNNLSTEADIVHNYNYPVDQLVESDSRVEEELSQRANAHRAGNNNGDGDTVGNRTSGSVEPRGGDKSSTVDAQQLDRNHNRRDGISEGDRITTSGKSSEKKRIDGPSKGVGNAVGGNSNVMGEKGILKNGGHIVVKRSNKSGSEDASSRKVSDEAINGDERMVASKIGPNRMRKVEGLTAERNGTASNNGSGNGSRKEDGHKEGGSNTKKKKRGGRGNKSPSSRKHNRKRMNAWYEKNKK